MTADGARIPPLPPDEWPPEMGEVIAAIRPSNPRHPFPRRDPGRPKGLNVLGMLAQHPALAVAYNTFTGHILFGTTLSPRQREMLILRVASVRQAIYEWKQHVVLASEAGLTTDEVTRIQLGADAIGWSSLDGALISAVDELVRDARVTDQTWEVLAAHLDVQQLMDLVFTVGAYDALAMAFRTFAIPLDDDLM
jgi:alkylhydroperoxidase family enzyme